MTRDDSDFFCPPAADCWKTVRIFWPPGAEGPQRAQRKKKSESPSMQNNLLRDVSRVYFRMMDEECFFVFVL